jgi:hypothetical protein
LQTEVTELTEMSFCALLPRWTVIGGKEGPGREGREVRFRQS